MAITPLKFSSYKELATRERCDYYMEVLSPEDFLRCKEYETVQANQVK